MNNHSFLTTIFGYVVPIGSLHDPVGKEGLANVFVDTFSFGKRNGIGVNSLIDQLEGAGGQFWAEAGLEVIYLYVRCPKDEVAECKELLEKIIHDIEISDTDLVNIKESLEKKILEVESDDREYAKIKFFECSMGERPSIGTKKSLKGITLEDIKEMHEMVQKNLKAFEFKGASDYSFDDSLEGILQGSQPGYKRARRKLFIDKEFEQKVLFYGYRTDGIRQFPFETTQVASSVMQAGLTGLVVEEIREKRSAAYYAGYRHRAVSDRGSAFMYAGVSEPNIFECTIVMNEIFAAVCRENVSEERINVAANYSIGKLARAFDSIDTLTFMYLLFFMHGREIKGYDEMLSDLKGVTAEDVKSYFKRIVSTKPTLVINGKMDDKTKANLSDLMK